MLILGLKGRDLVVIGGALLALLCAGVVATTIVVDAELSRLCAHAQDELPGDRLDALIAVTQSPRHTLAVRNRAVWALGQLRDRRAVPALEALLTGGPCDHERFVCQCEVQKALDSCRQTSWRVRFGNILRRALPAGN